MGDCTLFRRAEAIITCDDRRAVLRDADILVKGGRIAEIGAGIEAPEGAETIDARGWFIYPGLINTHHHFFQALVRNNAALDWTKLSVLEWLDLIYPLFARLDEDCFYHSSLVSLAELIKSGCTTAFDHQYNFPRHAGKKLIDRQFEAAELLGMRFHAGRGTNTLPKSEGSTIPEEMRETTDEFIADCERLLGAYHDASPFSMRRVVLAPCQPVNCYKETFTEAISLARSHGAFLHSHVGEGESEAIRARYGKRTVEWCEEIGFCGPDVWYAHCWELDEAEIRAMAASGTGVSHCPEPVYLVGAEVTPIPAMAAAGLRIGLGADGAASNDNSNLAHCIHSAYMLQALVSGGRADPVPEPAQFLRFATRGGADLLGQAELGSLEPGKAADLFAIDTSGLEYVGARHDPESFFAKVGHFRPTDLTMINGRIVWRDGEFPGIDEQKLAADAEAHMNSVLRGAA